LEVGDVTAQSFTSPTLQPQRQGITGMLRETSVRKVIGKILPEVKQLDVRLLA
jgi:hypothetical protein